MTAPTRNDVLATLTPTNALPTRMYFMGVSMMRCAYFSKRRVAAHVQKSASDGSAFLLVVADSLESVNYHYLRQLPWDEAVRRASAAGEAYARGYLRLARALPQLSIVRSGIIETTRACSELAAAVTEHFRHNVWFQHRIQQEVVNNLGARATPLLAQLGQAPRLEAYLLRELAISLTLYTLDTHHEIIQVSPNPHGVLATLHHEKALLDSIGIHADRLQYVEQELAEARTYVA